MYVCICKRVRERDVRTAIQCGARTEESVGAACGAGTGCGTCLDRICDLIEDWSGSCAAPDAPSRTGLHDEPADTLLPIAA